MSETTDAARRLPAPSITMYRVGGREYPLVRNSQCKVCCSPHRMEIEREVISGHGYSGIAKRWSEGWEVSSRNISDHYKSHMPATLATARIIVDRRAEALGKSIEDADETLVDHVTLAQTVVQKTFERIANGEVAPTVKEGIAAARLLAVVEEAPGGMDLNAMVEAFSVYMESAQRVMAPDQFERFGRLLATNPVLKALKERVRAEQEGRVIDVESG